MNFSPLDSALTGPMLTSPGMRACFSDSARLKHLLAAAVALAQARETQVTGSAGFADALAAIAPDRLDRTAIGREVAQAGDLGRGLAAVLRRHLPAELAGALPDADMPGLLDATLTLQCRAALGLVELDVVALIGALAALARTQAATAAAPVIGVMAAHWLTGMARLGARLPDLAAPQVPAPPNDAELGAWLAEAIGVSAAIADDIAARQAAGTVRLRRPIESVIAAARAVAPGLAMPLLAHPAGPAGWHVLPLLFGLAAGTLGALRRMLDGLQVDGAAMTRNPAGMTPAEATAQIDRALAGAEDVKSRLRQP